MSNAPLVCPGLVFESQLGGGRFTPAQLPQVSEVGGENTQKLCLPLPAGSHSTPLGHFSHLVPEPRVPMGGHGAAANCKSLLRTPPLFS